MNPPDIDGPRACRQHELDEVIALVDGVMREGSHQSFLTDYPLVYQDGNLQNIFVIKVNGDMASVVPFLPREVAIEDCRFSLGVISPTATAPEHRKQGYALKCLNACIEKMVSDGIDISVLWTLVPTFRFYEHAQYQAIRSQEYFYVCSKADRRLFRDNGHEVVVHDPQSQQYLADIQAMHEREICGVVRSIQDYSALFSLPKMNTRVALQDNEPVAYVVVSHATNRPGLVEAGGDKAAIETLIGHALTSLEEDAELKAYAYRTPTTLGVLLQEKMPERKTAMAANMMIRINDVFGFLEKILPWIERHRAGATGQFSVTLGDTGDVISFEFHDTGLRLGNKHCDTHFEMSLRIFTSIVFGVHPQQTIEVPEELKKLFPFYFPIWELDHS